MFKYYCFTNLYISFIFLDFKWFEVKPYISIYSAIIGIIHGT